MSKDCPYQLFVGVSRDMTRVDVAGMGRDKPDEFAGGFCELRIINEFSHLCRENFRRIRIETASDSGGANGFSLCGFPFPTDSHSVPPSIYFPASSLPMVFRLSILRLPASREAEDCSLSVCKSSGGCTVYYPTDCFRVRSGCPLSSP